VTGGHGAQSADCVLDEVPPLGLVVRLIGRSARGPSGAVRGQKSPPAGAGWRLGRPFPGPWPFGRRVATGGVRRAEWAPPATLSPPRPGWFRFGAPLMALRECRKGPSRRHGGGMHLPVASGRERAAAGGHRTGNDGGREHTGSRSAPARNRGGDASGLFCPARRGLACQPVRMSAGSNVSGWEDPKTGRAISAPGRRGSGPPTTRFRRATDALLRRPGCPSRRLIDAERGSRPGRGTTGPREIRRYEPSVAAEPSVGAEPARAGVGGVTGVCRGK